MRVGDSEGTNWVHIKRRWNVFCMHKYVLLAVWRVLSGGSISGEYAVHGSFTREMHKLCKWAR